MKKLSLALVFLALAGCQTVSDMVSPPDRSICKRLTTLCSLSEEDRKECLTNMEKVQVEKAELRKMATCMDQATSCAEAGGCAAGVGVNLAVDQANKFLKGLKRALKE